MSARTVGEAGVVGWALVLLAGVCLVAPSAAAGSASAIEFRDASFVVDAKLVSVAVGDVTGDGRNEVLATSGEGLEESASSLYLLQRATDGSLTPPLRYDLSGKDLCCNARQMGIAIGDLAGDGHNEVVVATSRGLDVFEWDGAKLVRSATLAVTGSPHHVRIADVDADGRADIVVRAGNRGQDGIGGVFILRNTSEGFVERRALTFSHYWQGALEVADVDGDGRGDVLLGANQLLVGLQQPDGSFAVASYDAGGYIRGLVAADLTADGVVDVAVTAMSRYPQVFANDGAGRLGDPAEHASQQLPSSLKADDLNGTGRADLVAMHSGGWSQIGSYEQDAGGLGEERLHQFDGQNATHHYSDSMVIADVDGDARPDVVFAESGRVVVLYNATDYQPDPPADDLAVERLHGPDRYATAVAVSRATFAAGAERVYVATGADFPDALTSGAAAAAGHGPVLLTRRDRLPAAVAEELRRLAPEEIVIVGGQAVVAKTVQDEISAFAPVRRLSGADRYATAAAVTRDAFTARLGSLYLASGRDFPDALAGTAAAASRNAPMLLTPPHALPTATREALEAFDPGQVFILGGSAAITEAVVAEVEALTDATVDRLAGADRYATAAAISQQLFPTASQVFVATGQDFPDALVAGPAASRADAPVILTPTATLHDTALAELQRLEPDHAVVLGGPAALSEDVVTAIRRATRQ